MTAPLDARAVTLALGGRWHGSSGSAPCPAHDDRTPSLSLADGRDGRLLAHCHAGCGWPAVADALRARGLLPGWGGGTPTGRLVHEDRDRARVREDARRAAQALRCWQGARPVAGTPAEAYLRGRAITAPLPPSLRFHPACWHGPTARRHPALVAWVTGADGPAVHRIFLDGRGRKITADPAKMALGPTRGGAVHVADAPHPPAPLVVAEGIETALALASGLLAEPAAFWATLGTTGLAALRLPAVPGRLVIAADGDAAGRDAAAALGRRARALGWRVRMLPAPEGRDWADVLMGRAPVTTVP